MFPISIGAQIWFAQGADTLAADMADTLNYLVDYPYGCVEQTMSRVIVRPRVPSSPRAPSGESARRIRRARR
mgnify:CR=1 FL=1